MSARTRSILAGMIRAARRAGRPEAWRALDEFLVSPKSREVLNPPGSQAVHREWNRLGGPGRPPYQRVELRSLIKKSGAHENGGRRTGASAEKRDVLSLARAYGWKGQSYRKAKRFARKLEREHVVGGTVQ